ncbi:MAG: hypothetical protein AB1576_07215 [Bacillota bacterium]
MTKGTGYGPRGDLTLEGAEISQGDPAASPWALGPANPPRRPRNAFYLSLRVRCIVGAVAGIFLGRLAMGAGQGRYFLIFVGLGFVLGFCLTYYASTVWQRMGSTGNAP